MLPPEMNASHEHYRAIWQNPKIRAQAYTSDEKFPSTESLKETMERVIPYWNNVIVPNVERGQRVLIVAHGTVLRSLVKYLDGKRRWGSGYCLRPLRCSRRPPVVIFGIFSEGRGPLNFSCDIYV